MSYAFFSEPVNGICEIMIRRTGKTAIGISTQEPLTDEQVQDLYWIVMAMSRTGKRLEELIGQK